MFFIRYKYAQPRFKERGVSIILFTLVSILVVLPLIGLAIDGSIVFWTKAKLTSALDAAALAAGRSPTSDPAVVARQYVYANLPSGWMGSSYTVTPTATIDYPTTGSRRVTITASVAVPLHFLRVLGVRNSTVSDTAASTRRNTNVVLLLDRSGSMKITGPDGNVVCDTMKASAQTFVSFFTDGQDQLGLVTFHAWSNVDFGLSTHFQTSSPDLNTVLSDLECGANTASAEGLELAYQQIVALGPSAYASTGSLNVIVFMTDGFPNGVTLGHSSHAGSSFIPKDKADDRYCVATPSSICTNTPATATTCQTSLASAQAGTMVQSAGGTAGFPFTGATTGIWPVYSGSPPTSVCATGTARPICNTSTPEISVSGTCNFMTSGSAYIRKDIAYISPQDIYGNNTVNNAYMTQASDLVATGPYTGLGHRVDTPQSLMDASFNTADAEALKIIQDTNFQPVIYVIGLGGAADMASEATFQRFLHRVANDSGSDRYNPNLPVGLFVYSPDDTQLQSAFRQVASQILRLSK